MRRALAAFTAAERQAGRARTTARERRGRSGSGGWRPKAILFRDAKGPRVPAENSRVVAIAAPGAPAAVALSKAGTRPLSG